MGTGLAKGEDRARDAAEASIRSPLLEDVNLQGARGILVNITSGLDMNLGEFTEVGNTVDEFASDNATVVIGTVVDPNMTDELKVTVVATGLGNKSEPKLKSVVNSKRKTVRGHETGEKRDLSNLRSGATSSIQTVQDEGARRVVGSETVDYLDIPAFLRRQAD
jgi:cell division protein FtsZ